MAKTITYKLATDGVPHGTKTLTCATEADFATSLPIAQEEAYNGEYTVEGEFDPEQDTASTDDVLNALLGVTE